MRRGELAQLMMFISSFKSIINLSSTHVGQVPHVVFMGLVQVLYGPAWLQIHASGLRQIIVSPPASLPVGIFFQSAFIPFWWLAVLFQRWHILAIYYHLSLALVFRISRLLEEFLIGVKLHFENGSCCPIPVLTSGVGGIVGAWLKERSDCVDEEEYDEDDVESEVGLSHLCLMFRVCLVPL